MFELMVVTSLLAVVTTILFERFLYYQEAAEKAGVEYTISALKSALRIRMADLLVQGRAQEYATLADDNPMDWLEQKPGNYAGEMTVPQAGEIAEGSWYFDAAQHALVYLVRHSGHFQSETGGKSIRLKAVIVPSAVGTAMDADEASPADSVSLKVVETYRWFPGN